MSQIVEVDARSTEIGPAPYAVELAMVGTPNVDSGHEAVESFSKSHPVKLTHALVGRYIGIVRALQHQVIDIDKRCAHEPGLVLAVTGRNGYN